MYEIEKTEEIRRLIEITRSDSGVSGPELVKAHIALGELLGMHMKEYEPNDTTIVAFLRGGIFFAEGIYFTLKCKFQTYDPKCENFVRPNTKNVILVDSVINSGQTIKDVYDGNMVVACNVINETAVPLFKDNLYTIRISKNSFVGSNVKTQKGSIGPDTTMRLFNQI